ncbi:MAG: carboxymuconolactone decarboxylase family protein [Solirubrobacterales bacterium]
MDERMKELVAIGASAAVNCHPCLQHHLAECDKLGLDREDVRAAMEVGLMVNAGAAAKTRAHVQALVGGGERQAGGQGGCGCP